MDKIKEYAKSLITFVATIAINMVISLLQGEQPWPQTQEEWIRYLGTAFTAALATAVSRNKMTQKQVDTAVEKGEVIALTPKTHPHPIATPDAPVFVPQHQEPELELPSSGNATVDDIIAEYQLKHHRTDQ